MASVKDFRNSSITVSEVKQGSEHGKGVWELNDWSKNFEILRAKSFCTIKLGSDQKHGVRIFFGDENTVVSHPQRQMAPNRTYVPLWVELVMDEYNYPVSDNQVTVSLDVHKLSGSLVSEKSFASGSVTINLGAKAAVIDTFLEYSYTSCGYGHRHDVRLRQPKSLRFGIIATISPSPINKPASLGSCVKRSSYVGLNEQLGKLYQSDVNFSDLKLETKDNKILSTHKFIVAARSSMFHEVIKMETEIDNFSGTIKVDVNAAPMLAILHWMYTGEVYEKTGLVMEQVIEAAVRFDLLQLLEMLDKKMINFCTEDNMFRLYESAKKCGMLSALKDIGAFIKSNV